MVPTDHAARLQRVRLALDGLSLGDVFGQHFFAPELWRAEFNSRELPPAPWKYTDDTEMALAIADVLADANNALGGNGLPAYVASFGDLNQLVTALNESYDNCVITAFAAAHLCKP